MALSEIWSIEVVLKVNKEKSDSNSNNSQNKLNFPTSNQRIEIDENHFKAQPEDVRENQAKKFADRLANIAKTLPFQNLLVISQDYKYESRWEKTKDWRRSSKIQVLQEIYTDLYEIGKYSVKIEHISSDEVRLHLNLDQEEIRANALASQKLKPDSKIASIFGALSGNYELSNQNLPEIRRDRTQSDVAPQIQNHGRFFFKEEIK